MNTTMKTPATGRCKDITGFLSSFQDNELDPVSRGKIKAHLTECGACRRQLELLDRVTAGVKQLPEVETAPNFTALVMNKVGQGQEVTSRRFGWLTLPAMVYSFIFILFFGLGFLANSRLADGPLNLNRDTAAVQDRHQEVYMAQLLTESRNLSLIDVQDKTMALLAAHTANGEHHEK